MEKGSWTANRDSTKLKEFCNIIVGGVSLYFLVFSLAALAYPCTLTRYPVDVTNHCSFTFFTGCPTAYFPVLAPGYLQQYLCSHISLLSSFRLPCTLSGSHVPWLSSCRAPSARQPLHWETMLLWSSEVTWLAHDLRVIHLCISWLIIPYLCVSSIHTCLKYVVYITLPY